MRESDYLALHKLRSSAGARYLHSVDSNPLTQRDYIRRARRRALAGEELYYAIFLRANLAEPVGFIRIADLVGKSHFSFHSLIISSEAPSFVAVDALFTAMQVGFELLEHHQAADLTLLAGNERMRSLHRAMGVLKEDRLDDNWVHLSASRSQFFQRRDFYSRYGFGIDPARFARFAGHTPGELAQTPGD